MTYRECVMGSAISPPRNGFTEVGRFSPELARWARWRTRVLSLLTLLMLMSGARAERDPASVTDVSFGSERLASREKDWCEAATESVGGRNTEPGARNPRFVDHIRVVLSVSFRVSPTGLQALSFYRRKSLFRH